jgi:dipeptide/tripeptide permease
LAENTFASANQKFPKAFWTANIVEIFERAAFYGMFISLSLYLSRSVGFNDIAAGWIGGIFTAGLYFLPTFSGAYADKIGFRRAIILAFALLAIGYTSLGILPYKAIVIPSLAVVMLGGSFIKSVITGTVAKSSNPGNRAKAFSIFYMMVNIGSFSGKTFAFPIRIYLGIEAINILSGIICFIALIIVFFLFKNLDKSGEGKTLKEVWDSFIHVLSNFRLITLIIIVTGFWIIQHQLYASMPKYVLRTVGEFAAPEWIANVNPFIVVTTVYLITRLMRKVKAISSMSIGMLLMPFSALCMASSPLLESFTGEYVIIFGLHAHPVTVMMIVGIVFQGFAECFISPRYLEYFSLQSPKGEEGLYLGFSHLHSFFSSLIGFVLSGYLLDAYCPDPASAHLKGLSAAQLAPFYQNANYIWYYFAAIGLAAAIALLIYGKVVNNIDKRTKL